MTKIKRVIIDLNEFSEKGGSVSYDVPSHAKGVTLLYSVDAENQLIAFAKSIQVVEK